MDVTSLTTNLVEGINLTNNLMDLTPFTIPPLPQGNVTGMQLLLWVLGVILAALPSILGYLKTLTVAKRQVENKKSTDEKLLENTTVTKKSNDKLVEVHDQINGRMEELIRKSVEAALAKGKLDGVAEEKNRKLAEEANQAIGKLAATENPIVPVPVPVNPTAPQIKI